MGVGQFFLEKTIRVNGRGSRARKDLLTIAANAALRAGPGWWFYTSLRSLRLDFEAIMDHRLRCVFGNYTVAAVAAVAVCSGPKMASATLFSLYLSIS